MTRYLRFIAALLLSVVVLPLTAAHAAPRSASAIDPQSLAIPTADFSPMHVHRNAATSAAALHALHPLHQRTFAFSGFQSGWLEIGSKKTPAGRVTNAYIASVYDSPSHAKADVEDVRAQFAGDGGGPYIVTCPKLTFMVSGRAYSYPAECFDFRASHDNGAQIIESGSYQVGRCAVTLQINGPTSILSDTTSKSPYHRALVAIAGDSLATIDRACAGDAAGTPTPTAATAQITGFGVVHQVKNTVKLTHVLKVGEAGIFIATYTLSSAAEVSGVLTISQGPKVIATASMASAQTKDGALYVYKSLKFSKQQIGTLRATVTITIGSTQETRTIDFQVTGT